MDREPARADYYAILQVHPGAHPEIVRAAYRTLLRALGKHPDLGGEEDEARTIIEAYKTLSDPERRRTYDEWLRAHSRPPAARPAGVPARPAAPRRTAPALAPGVVNWVHAVLGGFRDAPAAPFARSFDLVLEGPRPLSRRLYVKALPQIRREHWPTVFILCRAVGVARRGFMPSTDVVMFVAERVDDMDAFLEESGKHSAEWAWNRCLVCVCTIWPVRLHSRRAFWVPSVIRRLRAAVSGAPGSPRRMGEA